MSQGMFTLENKTADVLRIYADGQPFMVLMPRQPMCAPLDADYTGEILGAVVGRDGLTGRAQVAPSKPEALPGLVLVWR